MAKPIDLAKPFGRTLAYLSMGLDDHGLIRLAYNNFYEVGPGMYRCSQPSPGQIRKYHARYGIRSIINLRGPNVYGSYALEAEVCRELGITLYDTNLYSRTPPTPEEIHAIREVFESMPYPALLHCKSGADRAGLGAALYRILRLGHRVEDAMSELSWRYGHFRQAKTGVLDFALSAYVARNAREPIAFLDWVDTEYDPQAIEASFKKDGWASVLVDHVLHRE